MTYDIYLAGPDVFEPNAQALGETMKATCRQLGLNPLFPLDHAFPETTANLSERIYHANVALIRRADIVLANLNPFRGSEPDSGTVFEVGLAVALGIPVYGYIASNESLAARVTREQNILRVAGGPFTDKQGRALENFGLPLNLMLMNGLTQLIVGSFEVAVTNVAKQMARAA